MVQTAMPGIDAACGARSRTVTVAWTASGRRLLSGLVW